MLDVKEKFFEKYSEDEEFRAKVESFRRDIFRPRRKLSLRAIAGRVLEIAMDMGFLRPTEDVNLRIPDLEFGFDIRREVKGVEPIEVLDYREASDLVPAVVQPMDDIKLGNKLVAAYVKAFKIGSGSFKGADKVVEVSFVWAGEFDPFYGAYSDVWRLIAWGRVEDIETLHLIVSGDRVLATYIREALRLPDYGVWRVIEPAFSEESGWEKTQHVYRVEEVGELRLYINTWNHAFSFQDLIPDKEKVVQKPFRDFPVYEGWRVDAENKYSMLRYDSERFLVEEQLGAGSS